ncbi:MAG: hypothetical protein ACJAYC_002733 [Halieaceae bacterium]|jgi:hypothetical protein
MLHTFTTMVTDFGLLQLALVWLVVPLGRSRNGPIWAIINTRLIECTRHLPRMTFVSTPYYFYRSWSKLRNNVQHSIDRPTQP